MLNPVYRTDSHAYHTVLLVAAPKSTTGCRSPGYFPLHDLELAGMSSLY